MTHLSDLAIDRLLAGELDGTPAGATAREHLSSCGTCEGRRADIARDAEVFPKHVWIAGEAAKVRRAIAPAATPARRDSSALAQMVSFAAAAGIAAFAIFAIPPAPVDTTAIKGTPVSLTIFAQRAAGGRVSQLVPGDALTAGDSVRFQIWTDRAGALSIVGLDGAGQVSVYKHVELPQAVRGEILDGGVLLDDAPSAEVFFAVLCDRGEASAVPEIAARRALDEASNDPRRVSALGSGCHEASFLVRKNR